MSAGPTPPLSPNEVRRLLDRLQELTDEVRTVVVGGQAVYFWAHGNGWPASIVTAAHEIAAGHLRRRPAVKTRYEHGVVVGEQAPRNAAPVSVLGCSLGG